MKYILFTLLVMINTLSFSQRIQGVYCNSYKFADNGVCTVIDLKADSTFTYRSSGHMFDDRISGKYSIVADKIYFDYDTIPGHYNMFESELRKLPKEMRHINDRIFKLKENGKIIRSEDKWSLRRRYILFGKYAKRNKVFLEKSSEKNPCSS